MTIRHLSRGDPARDADLHGNNAAFTCPECAQVFIVSWFLDRQGRPCPGCGTVTGHVDREGKAARL